MLALYYVYDHRFDPAESASNYKTVEEALLQAAHDALTGNAQPIRVEDDGKVVRSKRQIDQAAKRLAAHRRGYNLQRDSNHPNPDVPATPEGELEAVSA